MVRTEKLSPAKLDESVCVQDILRDHKNMTHWNSAPTLYFSDIGDHGSSHWNNDRARGFSQYLHDAFKPEITLSQVNLALENITDSYNSVQIAFLQSLIIAHARCVLMVGGGSFQVLTLNNYVFLHREQECYVFRDGNCRFNYISKVYGGKNTFTTSECKKFLRNKNVK